MGRITGLFGISGWVKVYSFTDPIDNLIDYSPWLLGNDLGERALLDARRQGKTLIAQLTAEDGQAICSRDAAAGLVGADITVDRSQMPPLPKDQYYWCDLIGSAVVNRQRVQLGRVVNMLETGAHDVLVLEGERERLIPFAPGQTVDHVDPDLGRIDVDWPDDA
ncbi:16S rRNA processing protein RimM [Salinisphaera sp. USBA-960]|nr:16S rRNA processing protein RimM [Salifodinibacter halophilus]NNC26255.1 16S rRNA processing protein RimM [Salifodinibacter halophilus]